jgi:glycosyltransferase involved in cell wall biosynthesis
MSSLVFVTQMSDPADPGMGFAANLVRGLASRFDRVWVVANEVRQPFEGSGVEVISLGKERGAGKAGKAFALTRAISRLGRERSLAMLAHQCPIYLDIAAPVARWRRVPTMLWFAHPAVTPSLRVAEAAADVVLTSLPGAFPLASTKVRVIGQAIDVDAFSPAPVEPSATFRMVAVGRTSPSKGFATMIEALALVQGRGLDASLRIVGPSTTEAEHAHRRELRSLVERLDLAASVSIEDGVSPADVPGLIASGDALVNDMVRGSGDKVVFEAAALARPALVSNPSFAELLGGIEPSLRFPRGDAAELALRISELAGLKPSARAVIAAELRLRVERDHSLEHWSDAVRDAADRAIGARR